MSWKYPPNLLKSDYVIDSVALNENYLSVVDESSGYLNEHNFQAGLGSYILERPQLADGYAMKLFYSRADISSFDNTVPSDTDPTGENIPPDWLPVRATPSFQTYQQDGMAITFTSRGGPTWLCGSFTLHNSSLGENRMKSASDMNSSPGVYVGIQKGFGFNCALELDGSILYESLLGSGDPTNDYYNDEANSNSGPKLHPKGGGGIQGAANALVVDAIVILEPGSHTLRIAVQNIMSSDAGFVSVPAISSREIFALELTN